MKVRMKLSESFETEKSFSMLAALLQQCKGVAAMKVWLNQAILYPHTVMVPHGLSGEKSFSFSPLQGCLAHIC